MKHGVQHTFASKPVQMDANAQDALEKKEKRNTTEIEKEIEREIEREIVIKADKPPRTHFSPPSVDEVKAYCHEKGYNIDPDRFVNFYEAKGWVIGKSKMKSWQAAVRTWAKREDKPATMAEEFPDGCPWTVV